MQMVRVLQSTQRRGLQITVAEIAHMSSDAFKADLAAVPEAPAVSVKLSQVRHVFMTGATGLLGRQLVAELLRAGVGVSALVRASTCDLPPAVERVFGDLSLPRLGLKDFGRLQDVDAVIHCSAVVNWALPYEKLRSVNVAGTMEVVRLCAERGIALNYISTISVSHG